MVVLFNMQNDSIFSEEELKKIYFSLSKEIQRKRESLRLVSNTFLLNILQRETMELERLKTKVLKLKNNLNYADNIK